VSFEVTNIRAFVAELNLGALDNRPVTRQWDDDEFWGYISAPTCPCGGYARWTSGSDLADANPSDAVLAPIADDHAQAWRCAEPTCAEFGQEIEENGAPPMMSYDYPLPDFRAYGPADADLIADLPLCLVYDTDTAEHNGAWSLALTSGGMDYSDRICEAFMRLGFLPPFHFAREAAKNMDHPNPLLVAGLRRCGEEYAEMIAHRVRMLHEDLRLRTPA
jgi:hypothetical protein